MNKENGDVLIFMLFKLCETRKLYVATVPDVLHSILERLWEQIVKVKWKNVGCYALVFAIIYIVIQ